MVIIINNTIYRSASYDKKIVMFVQQKDDNNNNSNSSADSWVKALGLGWRTWVFASRLRLSQDPRIPENANPS